MTDAEIMEVARFYQWLADNGFVDIGSAWDNYVARCSPKILVTHTPVPFEYGLLA